MAALTWKKFALIIVFAVFKFNSCQAVDLNATGSKQSTDITPGQPININVYSKECDAKAVKDLKGDKGDPGASCKCNLQKPSAHIVGNSGLVTYQPNSDINAWTSTATDAHVAGGMIYHDGKLIIPTPGYYYVYVQAYVRNRGNRDERINVLCNGRRIMIAQTNYIYHHGLTAFTGGVFNFKAGDLISVRVSKSNTGIYFDPPGHSFFGAFMI